MNTQQSWEVEFDRLLKEYTDLHGVSDSLKVFIFAQLQEAYERGKEERESINYRRARNRKAYEEGRLQAFDEVEAILEKLYVGKPTQPDEVIPYKVKQMVVEEIRAAILTSLQAMRKGEYYGISCNLERLVWNMSRN